MEKQYKVYWKYRKSGKNKTIEENLTLDQAREIVQEDEKRKPSIKVKMMVYGKM